MNIKAPTVNAVTGKLSGGNQQKVVLSKWMYADPDVLILDEPTRGIDVGAKYEIYTIINALADQGKGDHRDLLRTPRTARHLRPHLHALRGSHHGGRPPLRGDARDPHAVHDPGTGDPSQ